MSPYQRFIVEVDSQVARVRINRPHKVNAMDLPFWQEIVEVFAHIDAEPSIRVVILSGEGEHFSSGIDLAFLGSLAAGLGEDIGRNAEYLRRQILQLQAAFNAVDRCSKPVLAAIHGYCLGGALDLITACDMRYASQEARFAIKEVDIGMAADVGTLQRLPRLIGDGITRELAYTGRQFEAEEAQRIGLLNRCYESPSALFEGVGELARQIAAKSPLAVRGSKQMLRYMRDHRVDDGLEYIATWNAAMLQSHDLRNAVAAQLKGSTAEFAD